MPEKLVKYLAGKEVPVSGTQARQGHKKTSSAEVQIQAIFQDTLEAHESFEELAWKVEKQLHKKMTSTCLARDAETHPEALKAKEEILRVQGHISLRNLPEGSTREGTLWGS